MTVRITPAKIGRNLTSLRICSMKMLSATNLLHSRRQAGTGCGLCYAINRGGICEEERKTFPDKSLGSINFLRSNEPSVGYNQWAKFKG
jgi:hypothetical protein